tara:strand:- start:41 stop:511 length:471 start_codon:yes stop_codon:yes gene_type:complete
MKKLFSTILVLGLLLSGNAYAENIFDCEIKTKDSFGNPVSAKFIIRADDDYSAALKTGDSVTGKFYSNKDFILSVGGNRGDLIITSQFNFVPKGSYDLYVTQNAVKNDNSYFRALFSESGYNGLVHSLTITPWEENMPISFYLSNNPQSIIKGNCK